MDAGSERMQDKKTAVGFLRGLRTGIPIAIGYVPSALACGILSRSAGLTLCESAFMSAVVYAGSSQFAALNLINIRVSLPEIVLAAAVLNMRYILMTSSLSCKFLPSMKAWEKILVCSMITDESFSLASMLEEDLLAPSFMLGLNIIGYVMWIMGTVLGFIGTAIFPQSVQDSMGIAIYALFIGLLVPSIRNNKAGLLVAASAMALSALIKWAPCFASVNRGMAIMIAAVAASSLGVLIYPKGD